MVQRRTTWHRTVRYQPASHRTARYQVAHLMAHHETASQWTVGHRAAFHRTVHFRLVLRWTVSSGMVSGLGAGRPRRIRRARCPPGLMTAGRGWRWGCGGGREVGWGGRARRPSRGSGAPATGPCHSCDDRSESLMWRPIRRHRASAWRRPWRRGPRERRPGRPGPRGPRRGRPSEGRRRASP